MKGILYGIGVGPGDPQLLTIKAVKQIQESEIIAVPGETVKESVAYQIALGAVTSLANKECIPIFMPMTKDEQLLEQSHDLGAKTIASYLDQGKTVAFLTLGDPTVYSTYWYLQKKLMKQGYETRIISGIPSFCAVAAKLNTALVEKSQPLHVLPASYEIEEMLKMPGTKVLMKSGKKLKAVKERLLQENCSVMMMENCGMEEEKTYYSAKEMPETGSYYSLIIVKETT